MQKKRDQTEKSRKLKQHIFDVAMKLITKKGFHRITVDEICGKVGISKGNFYYYYPSKDSLMMELFHQNDQIYLNEYWERIRCMEQAEDKLMAMSQVISEYIVQQGVDVLKNVYYSQIDPIKINIPFRATERPFYNLVRGIIKEGQEKGEFRRDIPTEEMAMLSMMGFRGLSYEWCLRNGGFDLLDMTTRIMSLFIDSIRAKDRP